MRLLATAAVLLLVAAGCIGGGPPDPPVVTTTGSGAMVFQTDGETIVPVPLPPEFGTGLRVASVATGFQGAEPNIGVLGNGYAFVSAYESILRSRDGGRSWQEVYRMQLGQTFDPMLWVDVPTGRVYSVHIYPDKTCSTLIHSDDADAERPTWRERPLHCPSPLVDHQKLATGPLPGPLAAAEAVLPYPRLVTMCYNKLLDAAPARLSATHCAVSLDGGATFPIDREVDAGRGNPLPRGSPAQCGGLNGHQAHGPDGTILLPYGYDCRRGRVAVSTDGGLTWARRDLNVDQFELDPEAAFTPDGTSYYVYRGADQALHMLRSRDNFGTSEGPFRLSPPEVKATVFAGLAAGSDGRIAVAYLGTRQDVPNPDDAGPDTVWSLYTGMSLDAASPTPTVVTVQATPESDPVQRGSICHSKPCDAGNRNLLDFIDMAVGPDGRFWVSFADGCTSDACRTPGQADVQTSRDDTASVAWLLEGPSLDAALAPLRP